MSNRNNKPFDLANGRIKFGGIRCIVSKEKYSRGGTALVLNDETDGEVVCVATINIPGAKLAADEVVIKDYSENEGILETLESAGVIARTGRTVKAGFVDVPVCKLLI